MAQQVGTETYIQTDIHRDILADGHCHNKTDIQQIEAKLTAVCH